MQSQGAARDTHGQAEEIAADSQGYIEGVTDLANKGVFTALLGGGATTGATDAQTADLGRAQLTHATQGMTPNDAAKADIVGLMLGDAQGNGAASGQVKQDE